MDICHEDYTSSFRCTRKSNPMLPQEMGNFESSTALSKLHSSNLIIEVMSLNERRTMAKGY